MSKFKNVFPARAEVKKALADFTAAWSSDYLKVDDENSKQVAIARFSSPFSGIFFQSSLGTV